MIKTIIPTLSLASLTFAVVVISDPNNPPHQVAASEGQIGYNDCQNYKDSPTSMCQTVYFNSFEDFCVFAPPNPNSVIGDTEGEQVTWCTMPGHGARLIPAGTFKSLHWLQTPDYVQITSEGDFTKINVKKGDEGGELDPYGATNEGNPVGGVVVGKVGGTYVQYQVWHEYIAYNELSLRACNHNTGKDTFYCPHVYDEQGSQFNDAGDYDSGFSTCKGDDVLPSYIYTGDDGKTTTFHQGDAFTPDARDGGKTSSCTNFGSYSYTTYSTSTKTTTTTTTKKTTTTTTKKTTTTTPKKTTTTTTTKKTTTTTPKKTTTAAAKKTTTTTTKKSTTTTKKSTTTTKKTTTTSSKKAARTDISKPGAEKKRMDKGEEL